MEPRNRVMRGWLCAAVLLFGSVPALGGVHLWRVKEVFSNADGTVQFIEIATCCGSTSENFTGGHAVFSNSHSFTITSNVAGSTLNKHILLATADFAALPGAPTPNYTIANNFFSTSGDSITFSVYDTLTFASGQLPTNGTMSLNKDPNDETDTPFSATNSPTNYAGQSGAVVAASGPPAVPDGNGPTSPMRVDLMAPDGSSLRISFDTASCVLTTGHHILFGQKSGFPATPGGGFSLLGGVCSIGTTSPYAWFGVPNPIDGSGLIWILVLASDAVGNEGSWGLDGKGNERRGPGPGGSSGTCAASKQVTNSCGNGSP